MSATRQAFAFSLSALLLACAGARPMGGAEPPIDACPARVEANGIVPGKQPDKVLRNPRAGFKSCYTGQGMLGLAKTLACDSGYAFASLINIQEPGFLNGSCYRADVEFYKSDSGARVSPEPVIKYATVDPTGLDLMARMNLGTVTGGLQSESGLVSEKGDTASTNHFAFYLGLRYYFLPFLGMEAETGGKFGSAVAPKTKAMEFTNAWKSNIGLSLIPWQRMTLGGRLQTALSGGFSYTRLSLDDEYKKFVSQNSGILFYDDAADGVGWYAGGQVRLITPWGLINEIGIRYSEEYPKFPKGTRAFSGTSVLLDMGLGYRF